MFSGVGRTGSVQWTFGAESDPKCNVDIFTKDSLDNLRTLFSKGCRNTLLLRRSQVRVRHSLRPHIYSEVINFLTVWTQMFNFLILWKFSKLPPTLSFSGCQLVWCGIKNRLVGLSARHLVSSPVSHCHAGTVPQFLKHACKNRHGDKVWCPVHLWIQSSLDWIQAPVIIATVHRNELRPSELSLLEICKLSVCVCVCTEEIQEFNHHLE